jgi:hypothetical protein
MDYLYLVTLGKWKPMRWSFLLSIIVTVLFYLNSIDKNSEYYNPDASILEYAFLWLIIFISITVFLYLLTWLLDWLMPQE